MFGPEDEEGKKKMSNTKSQVLIVEDQPREREAMARLLRTEGFQPVTAQDSAEAIRSMSSDSIDLVLCDLRLGQESGVELMKTWKASRPETPFVIITAFGEVQTAVDAMKLGAADYLTKPVNPEALMMLIRRLSEQNQDSSTNPPWSGSTSDIPEILGHSPAMIEVKERVRRAAQADSLVLILGESGTGKELVAAAIHRLSRRSSGPYVAVNIAAVPESLVEAELFGHIKGAYTGAATDREGRFEAAHTGTLFIDEVGDFPIASQSKLLRVLENYIVTPVGSNLERRVDVRVVAATSRNLLEMVDKGFFRRDLFFRLNVLTIELPPLRERREDLTELIAAFLKEACQKHSRKMLQFSPDLASFMASYDWPGNVRQLRNAIENMVVMSRGDTLSLQDLPAYLSGTPLPPSNAKFNLATGNLYDLEKTAILAAMDRFHGNRTKASESLGISVRTLQRKLKAWEAEADRNSATSGNPETTPEVETTTAVDPSTAATTPADANTAQEATSSA